MPKIKKIEARIVRAPSPQQRTLYEIIVDTMLKTEAPIIDPMAVVMVTYVLANPYDSKST